MFNLIFDKSLWGEAQWFVKSPVEGMRVGERRKIFIHPDLAYKTIGHVPPNSLLIVEVEVLDVANF